MLYSNFCGHEMLHIYEMISFIMQIFEMIFFHIKILIVYNQYIFLVNILGNYESTGSQFKKNIRM